MANAAIDLVVSTLRSRDDRVVRAVAFRTLLRSFNDHTPTELIYPTAYSDALGYHEDRYPQYIRRYLPYYPHRPRDVDAFRAAVPAIALRSLLRSWLEFFDYPIRADTRLRLAGIEMRWDAELWYDLTRDRSINDLLRASISLDPMFGRAFWRIDGATAVFRLLEAQPELLTPLVSRDLETGEFGALIQGPLWPSNYPGRFSPGLFSDVFVLQRYSRRSSAYAWLEGIELGRPRIREAEEALGDLERFLEFLSGRRDERDDLEPTPRSAPRAEPPAPRRAPEREMRRAEPELREQRVERAERELAQERAELERTIEQIQRKVERTEAEPGPTSELQVRLPRSLRRLSIVRAAVGSFAGKVAGWLSSPFTSDTIQTDTSRYTDISIFSGEPEHLGVRVAPNRCLVFGKVYTLEAAIRHSPIGLPALDERTDITQFVSQTGPSELLAVLTSDDVAPGQTGSVDIPFPVQTIVVPRTGDSEKQALFQITPLNASGEARRCNLVLRLYYKLDLIDQIQISVLIGPRETAKESGARRPTLFLDSIKKRALPDFAFNLAPRSLNIVVSRSPDGSKTRLDFVLPQHNAHFVGAVSITNSELNDLLSKIRDQLFDMALNAPVETTSVDPLLFRNQLRHLAQLGEQAKQLLFDFGKSGTQASLRKI